VPTIVPLIVPFRVNWWFMAFFCANPEKQQRQKKIILKILFIWASFNGIWVYKYENMMYHNPIRSYPMIVGYCRNKLDFSNLNFMESMPGCMEHSILILNVGPRIFLAMISSQFAVLVAPWWNRTRSLTPVPGSCFNTPWINKLSSWVEFCRFRITIGFYSPN
jgi:hypothetical protein